MKRPGHTLECKANGSGLSTEPRVLPTINLSTIQPTVLQSQSSTIYTTAAQNKVLALFDQ